MGIGRLPQSDNSESQRPVQIITKSLEPVVYASKKLYQSDPQSFLELVALYLLIALTFIGEIVSNLPWGWYLAVLVLIIGYYKVVPVKVLKKLIKRKK